MLARALDEGIIGPETPLFCENGRFTGYHVDGGYSEAVIVPEKFAYSIPPQFSDEHAAPLLLVQFEVVASQVPVPPLTAPLSGVASQ